MSGWHNQTNSIYSASANYQQKQQTGFGTLQTIKKPSFKLGLPVPARQLPPLQFKSQLKELPMPPPNVNYSVVDNRDFVKNDMKKQMEWSRNQRLNPDYIERR